MAGLNAYAALGLGLMFIQIILGVAELVIIYAILRRTPHRLYHLAVPAWILVIGYFIAKDWDILMIIFGSFLLIAPMTALLPGYIVPSLTDPESSLGRVVVSYVGVSLFEIFFVFSFFASDRPFDPQFYYFNTALDNALYYWGIVAADMLLACFVFLILLELLPVNKAPVMKTE
jgi:hypothetical protein